MVQDIKEKRKNIILSIFLCVLVLFISIKLVHCGPVATFFSNTFGAITQGITDEIFEGLGHFLSSIINGVTDFASEATTNAFTPTFDTFDASLSGMGSYLTKIARYGAYIIAILIFVWGIFSCIWESVTGDAKDTPLNLLFRFLVAIILITATTYKNGLLDIFFNVTNKAYEFVLAIEWEADPISVGDILGWVLERMLVINLIASAGLFMIVIALIAAWPLIKEFFKYWLEMYERYLIACLLIIFFPLGIAAFTSRKTSDVTSKYMNMTACQMILLIFNFVFTKMFFVALAFVSTGTTGTGFILNYFLLLAILELGQKVDSIMKGMGLSAAQTGGSLATSGILAAGMILSTGKGISSAGLKNGGAVNGGEAGRKMDVAGSILSGRNVSDALDKGIKAASVAGGAEFLSQQAALTGKVSGTTAQYTSAIRAAINGDRNAKSVVDAMSARDYNEALKANPALASDILSRGMAGEKPMIPLAMKMNDDNLKSAMNDITGGSIRFKSGDTIDTSGLAKGSLKINSHTANGTPVVSSFGKAASMNMTKPGIQELRNGYAVQGISQLRNGQRIASNETYSKGALSTIFEKDALDMAYKERAEMAQFAGMNVIVPGAPGEERYGEAMIEGTNINTADIGSLEDTGHGTAIVAAGSSEGTDRLLGVNYGDFIAENTGDSYASEYGDKDNGLLNGLAKEMVAGCDDLVGWEFADCNPDKTQQMVKPSSDGSFSFRVRNRTNHDEFREVQVKNLGSSAENLSSCNNWQKLDGSENTADTYLGITSIKNLG